MLPLALALAPGIAIAFFIYWKDKFNREPGKYAQYYTRHYYSKIC
jgi:hypothetical protein